MRYDGWLPYEIQRTFILKNCFYTFFIRDLKSFWSLDKLKNTLRRRQWRQQLTRIVDRLMKRVLSFEKKTFPRRRNPAFFKGGDPSFFKGIFSKYSSKVFWLNNKSLLGETYALLQSLSKWMSTSAHLQVGRLPQKHDSNRNFSIAFETVPKNGWRKCWTLFLCVAAGRARASRILEGTANYTLPGLNFVTNCISVVIYFTSRAMLDCPFLEDVDGKSSPHNYLIRTFEKSARCPRLFKKRQSICDLNVFLIVFEMVIWRMKIPKISQFCTSQLIRGELSIEGMN